jgi:hypothetical protein
MVYASLLAVALAATSVSARTGALGPTNNYIAPLGVQIGTISQSINCTVYLDGTLPVITNATFSLVLGGALTTSVNKTGSFYLVGRAVVTGSQAFTASLLKLQVKSFNGTLNSSIIETVGGASASVDIAKTNTVNFPNQTVTAGKAVVLNIPATTAKALKIGPVKPGTGSSSIEIALGANVVLTKAVIGSVSVPVTIKCPANNPLDYLAFVTVGGSGTAPLPGDYPPVTNIASGSVLGSTGLNYNCAFTGITGNLTVPTSLTTYSTHLTIPAGKPFQYTNSHGTVNISQTTVAKVKAALPTPAAGAAFSIAISQIRITGTGINPTALNGLAKTATSDIIKLNSTTGTYSVSIPGSNGLLPPINFTASTTKQVALVYLGQATVTVNAYDSKNTLIKTFAGVCSAPSSPKAPLLPINVV